MAVEQAKSRRVGEMFERNSGFIETAARWLTRNSQDAEDVMQGAAEALLKGREYRGLSDEGTFLFEVICNEARRLNRVRTAMRRGGGQSAQSLDSLPLESLGSSPSAETVAIFSETIREASEEPCIALKLVGYSTPEIAEMIGIGVPAVKSRVHRWRVENQGNR